MDRDRDIAAKHSERPDPRGWFRRNVHFLVALVLLGAIAAGIYAFPRADRQPVPWPEGVDVSEQFQLSTFPQRVGPYESVAEGEKIIDKATMRALGLGTSYDEERRPLRRSNWYLFRTYEDTRLAGSSSPYRYWRLELYYYTGLRDNVPHVPERCLEAGGVQVKSRQNVSFSIPAAIKGWDDAVKFRRVHFLIPGPPGISGREGVEYYIFSLNGRPETRWESVRLALSYPTVRHCFFAKIQFTPFNPQATGGIQSLAEADSKSQEFMSFLLPAALRALPARQDIERLDSQRPARPADKPAHS